MMEVIRCFSKCIKSYRCLKCLSVLNARTFSQPVCGKAFQKNNTNVLQLMTPFANEYRSNNAFPGKLIFCFSLGFLDFFRSKEYDPEEEMITTLKRSVLLIQQEEFKLAEQMLHIALKQAQDQRSSDGITYAYDLMANLALTTGQWDKAEKLFVTVMNRLITNDVPKDDRRNLHISLKLAKIFQEKKERSKAEVGYQFCLEHLEKHAAAIHDLKVQKVHFTDEQKLDNDTTLGLYGMTLDWYAKFLLEEHKFEESLKCYKKAYRLCVEIHGETHEQAVIILNDIGTVNYMRGNYEKALKYLNRAIEVGKHLPNMEDMSAIYINLGKVYLEQGLKSEAEKNCRDGWKNAHRMNNEEGIKEAESCLAKLHKVGFVDDF